VSVSRPRSDRPVQTGRVLVTGAEGTVGRELVTMLVAAGVLVRAGTHRPASVVGEEDTGYERVFLDYETLDSLLNAMRDVEVVYLVTPQVPRSVEYVRAAVTAARRCGVGRIVRQSVFNADSAGDAISLWHRSAEALIASSGLAYSVLRPNSFMQNFVTIYRESIVCDDLFSLPLGHATLSNVDARDIATAATALLMDDEFDETAFTLTGPRALSGDEMAGILSGVTGRLIRYRDAPEDVGRMPRNEAERSESAALRELGVAMRAGRLAAVTDDVERLTGRAPISFEQFARDHVWAFARQPTSGYGGIAHG
jgi:uncharacterized protein YbjT (DUF2867 family)